ncbi:MAG: helix-turn-helix transcriptional regulator [Acidobacteriota bacterium]|jgi:DNA-binding PadR family transcriptional regulator
MTKRAFLGEFEQMVLLAILQQGDTAFGLEVRREIEASAEREVSRGAFYTTVDRLERKGLVSWEEAPPGGRRGGAPQRLFHVTGEGIEALRVAHQALEALSRDLDDLWEES